MDAGRHASDSAASIAEAPLADRLVRHPDPLDAIYNAMRMGLHDAVLEALSKLPVPLADSPDARMLGIPLDIERGRFDSADRRLALELERARSGNDRVWEARLLVLRSERHIKASSHGAECIRPAQSALSLLAAAGSSAPPHTIGRALSARGVGHLKEGQLALAREDLVRAQDILQSTGDEWSIAENRRQLATVWLAMGRMNDALDALVTAADKFQRLGDPVGEMGTRNMATRIQIEQLRWDEALAGTQRTLEVARMVPATRRNIGALQLRGVVLTATGQLRQARSLLEEVHGIETRRYTPVVLAAHMLAADRPREAFRYAEAAFALHQSGDDHRNLVLESKEGAMLLWMTAAQRIAESGAPMPTPSPAQLAVLQNPQSNIGRIARARWLWSRGESAEAEAELRAVGEQPRAPGWLSDTLYANEALVALLLQRGDAEGARQALTEMWGYDPERFSRDYAANLLALRVALASSDDAQIKSAYRTVRSLAGERVLPAELDQAYARRIPRPVPARNGDASDRN